MLLRVQPYSGHAEIVGNTGLSFAGIAFSSDGTLYGVTGDGSDVSPETLFTISLIDGSPTFHTGLGAGDDGETIAFNFDDGMMYHASGLGFQGVHEFFESISLPGSPGTVTDIPLSGDDYDELFGMVYVGSGIFIGIDIDAKFYTISTTGVVTDLGIQIQSDLYFRGMALAPDPDGDGCPGITPVPTLGQWGLILLSLLLLIFGILAVKQRVIYSDSQV